MISSTLPILHYAIDRTRCHSLRALRLPLLLIAASIIALPATALSHSVDVTTFGAIPNDGLGDYAALNTAIAAHDEIYIPAGVYDISQTLYIPSQRRLTGASRDAVVIRLATDTVAVRIDGQRNIKISGMTFERPLAFENSSEEMLRIYNSSSNVQLHQLRILNHRSRGAAAFVLDSYDCAVTQCEFLNVQTLLQEFDDGETNWEVYGSAIHFVDSAGVLVEDCQITESRDLVAEWESKPEEERTKYNWYQAGALQINHCVDAVARNNQISTTGGSIGFYADTSSPSANNRFDNFSVTVGRSDLAPLFNDSGTNTLQGKITLSSPAAITAATGTHLTLDTTSGNSIEASSQDLILDADGTIEILDPIVLGSGSLTKTGAGTAILAAPNSYTGDTIVIDGDLLISRNDFTATIETESITIDFSSPPAKGATFQLLPSALAGGIPEITATGLTAGHIATFSQATSTITVNTLNLPPVINSGQSFSIPENSEPDTAVGSVLATDGNDDILSTWTIVTGNTNRVFTIDSDGLITVNGSLDHESQSSYNLGITVSDGMATSAEAALFLNIENVGEYSDILESYPLEGDSNNDGIPNLLAYALGATSPSSPAFRPTLSLTASDLSITAVIRINDPKLTVVGQVIAELLDYSNSSQILTIN